MPLLICFLNHNFLLKNAEENDNLDGGKQCLLKTLMILLPLCCLQDCELPEKCLICKVRRTDLS